MEFKEAAYQILRRAKKPLSYHEITEIALRDNLISSDGKTPEASMGALLYVDIKRKGNESKFFKVGKGVFGLAEWYGVNSKLTDLVEAVINPYNSIVDKLETTQCQSDKPNEFEEAIREAFVSLGFEGELIGGSGDTDVLLTANIGDESFKVSVDVAMLAKEPVLGLEGTKNRKLTWQPWKQSCERGTTIW